MMSRQNRCLASCITGRAPYNEAYYFTRFEKDGTMVKGPTYQCYDSDEDGEIGVEDVYLKDGVEQDRTAWEKETEIYRAIKNERGLQSGCFDGEKSMKYIQNRTNWCWVAACKVAGEQYKKNFVDAWQSAIARNADFLHGGLEGNFPGNDQMKMRGLKKRKGVNVSSFT